MPDREEEREPVGIPLPDARQAPREWLRENRVVEAATKVETEAGGEKLGPEGRERATI